MEAHEGHLEEASLPHGGRGVGDQDQGRDHPRGGEGENGPENGVVDARPRAEKRQQKADRHVSCPTEYLPIINQSVNGQCHTWAPGAVQIEWHDFTMTYAPKAPNVGRKATQPAAPAAAMVSAGPKCAPAASAAARPRRRRRRLQRV